MTTPQINVTQLDGALGVLPSTAGRLLAVVGTSSAGTANVPTTFARVNDAVGTFGQGPLVEAAARRMQRYGKPVLMVRAAAASVIGAYGTPVDNVSGTSAVTVDTDDEPFDDYDFIFEVIAGGTIGTAGITYRYSLDNGENYSPITALGTANTLTLDGNVGLDFGAGTLVAGDTFSVRTTAPAADDTELLAALTALGQSALAWDLVYVTGATDATSAGVIETWISGLVAAGKYRGYFANTRTPNAGESEATYAAALAADFSSFATTYGTICAGAADIVSSVSGRNYRRPIAHYVAAAHSNISEEANLAALDTEGPAAGVSVRDSLGNPRHHDEAINPGLDDSRFCVLRTWDQEPGVYVNIPRLMSSAGSDFQLMPHRRVMNLALEAATAYMRRRLSKPVRVDAATGYIREVDAAEIDRGLTAAVGGVLLAKPKASSVTGSVSRTDAILSTNTLTANLSVVPLGYPTAINLTVGFTNPALAAAAS